MPESPSSTKPVSWKRVRKVLRSLFAHRTRPVLLLIGTVAGALALPATERTRAADEEPQEKKRATQKFMREKLKDAQQVLEGIATEDFKMIAQGAKHMEVMSRAAEWQIVGGPVYAQHSAEFREACEQMSRRAEAGNLDGAGLAYLRATMACINCHKFLRETRIVMNPLPTDELLVTEKRAGLLDRTSP